MLQRTREWLVERGAGSDEPDQPKLPQPREPLSLAILSLMLFPALFKGAPWTRKLWGEGKWPS